jgi:sarcosine oxidase subunit beta
MSGQNPERASTRERALPRTAEAVVIGGGVIGTSIAFHLAEAGVQVLLVERDALAAGSTSRAAGGIRAQFSDALNIQIAQRSIAAYCDFGRRPGWEIDFRQVGYLFVLSRPAHVELFSRSIERQRAFGVPSRLLTPEQARELCPLIEGEDIIAAAYSPQDGHATPEAVVQGYAAGARRHGARVLTGVTVSDIAVEGGRIERVVTDRGSVLTELVICAAGAWSGLCGQMVGVDLPVTPLRRQVLFTGPIPGLPPRLPMTVDFASSFYFHREGPGLLMGMSDPNEEPGFRSESSDEWIADLMKVVARRAPAISEAPIRGGWAGLYEMTPDHNAIVGEAPHVSRFLYASGFSGHGFLQAPAVGEIVRDLVLRARPFVDITPLSAERFQLHALRPELHVI